MVKRFYHEVLVKVKDKEFTMDIFKEMWQEIPNRARLIAGLIFLVFAGFCVWACLSYKISIDQEEDIPDLYGVPTTSLVQ